MRAMLRCQLARQIVVFGVAILALVVFIPVARSQQRIEGNTSPSDWLRKVSYAGETEDRNSSSLVVPTEESTAGDFDCGCCCNMCPCTYGVVEALILQRNLAGSSFPLVVDAATGNSLLTTNNLRFPFAGGLRAYFGHRFRDCWAWELGYFGLYGASASAITTGNLALPGDFSGLNVFFGADRVAANYNTNLNGGEFNLVNCCSSNDLCGCQTTWDSVEWLYGFRYLRIDDNLGIAAQRAEVGGLEQGSYNVQAANNLYGGQVGTRLRRCWGLWSVEGTGKAGLYYNQATQSQTVTDFPNFVVRQASSSNDHLALLAELNASVIRQITDYWYFRGGYNLIWIDGVALAPNQLDFSLTNVSGATTHTGGTMFLHGVNVGLEARW